MARMLSPPLCLAVLLGLFPLRVEAGGDVSAGDYHVVIRPYHSLVSASGLEVADTVVNAVFATEVAWLPFPWVAKRLSERTRELRQPWRNRLGDIVPIPSNFICRVEQQRFVGEAFGRYWLNCLVTRVNGTEVLLWGGDVEKRLEPYCLPARLLAGEAR